MDITYFFMLCGVKGNSEWFGSADVKTAVPDIVDYPVQFILLCRPYLGASDSIGLYRDSICISRCLLIVSEILHKYYQDAIKEVDLKVLLEELNV